MLKSLLRFEILSNSILFEMKILFNGHQGTLFHIQTTVNQVNTREVWDNTEKKKFIDAVFLQVTLG